MKKLSIFVFGLFFLVFSSCATTVPTDTGVVNDDGIDNDTVEIPTPAKDWLLSFDIPEGWITKEMEDTIVAYTEGASEGLYLQNTSKVPLFSSGWEPDDYSEEKYADDDVIQVAVLHLDPTTVIPPVKNYGVTDLGGGFTQVKTCDDVTYPECGLGGNSSYTYFLETSNGEKFSFHYYTNDRTMTGAEIEAVVESIILSARE